MSFVYPAIILLAAALMHGGSADHINGSPYAVGFLFPLILALGVTGLTWAAARTNTRRTICRLRLDGATRLAALQAFRRIERARLVIWLAAITWLYGVVGFATWPTSFPVIGSSFLLRGIIVLAPLLVAAAISSAAAYDVAAADRIQTGRQPYLDCRSYVSMQLRHQLGMFLIPLGAFWVVTDGLALFTMATPIQWNPVTWSIVATIIYVLVYPEIVRHVWRTEPLPEGPLRNRLTHLARHAGVGVRDILVWRTGNASANAALIGFFFGHRYVLLTQGLLGHLSDEAIEAAFAHELGHAKFRHVPLRMLVLLAPVSIGFALVTIVPSFGDWVTAHLPHQSPLLIASVIGLAAIAYLLLIFGRVAAVFEAQADAFACQILREARPSPERAAAETSPEPFPVGASNASEVVLLGETIERLNAMGGQRRNQRTWQHASTARRVSTLQCLAQDPDRSRRLDRRVRLVGSALAGMACGSLILVVW